MSWHALVQAHSDAKLINIFLKHTHAHTHTYTHTSKTMSQPLVTKIGDYNGRSGRNDVSAAGVMARSHFLSPALQSDPVVFLTSGDVRR